MIDAEEFTEFESLVGTSEAQTERECAKYLHHAIGYLVPGTPVEMNLGAEDRNFFGATDFVVSATLRNDRNAEERYAYIWELKAPQCFLFESDDNANRYRPTKEFIKAENQLLHYSYQAQSDQSFRQRFKVMDYRNIKIGGIIIGRSNDRIFRGPDGDIAKAEVALSVREEFLYRAHGIRVLTWDRLLDFVRPKS